MITVIPEKMSASNMDYFYGPSLWRCGHIDRCINILQKFSFYILQTNKQKQNASLAQHEAE